MSDTAGVVTSGAGRGSINLRIDAGDRNLIDRLAAVLGKTRTQFLIDSAKQYAADVLLDQRQQNAVPAHRDHRRRLASIHRAIETPQSRGSFGLR